MNKLCKSQLDLGFLGEPAVGGLKFSMAQKKLQKSSTLGKVIWGVQKCNGKESQGLMTLISDFQRDDFMRIS